MIKAYLVGISTQYENEDIEIRYRIFKDEKLLCEKSILQGYEKPLIVSHVALISLLRELEKYKDDEITIYINDAALSEQIRGTSTTKNKYVLKMARIVREQLIKFKSSVVVVDVSANYPELMVWNDILKF